MKTLFRLLLICLPIASTATAKYSGGSGTAADPYQIATAADLIALGEDPNDYDKHFILTADIDLDPNLPGRKVFDKAVVAPDAVPWNWEVICDGTPFTGVFDGNGHTVSHLTIRGRSYLGLFGQLGYPASVSNLGLEAVEVSGTGCVGGLVGLNLGRSIGTSYSSGLVSGDWSVGGLVGWNYGSIVSSYTSGWAIGTYAVGGFVGDNHGSIATSYSSGSVSGTDCVGGLVAYNYGGVTQCYSSALVSGTSDVGGLVGWNGDDGSIASSYSSGSVSGLSDVGGLVGSNTNPGGYEGVVSHSFWDTQTSGQMTSAGGTGKTTPEMQDSETFLSAGWDFVAEIGNGTHQIWQMPQEGGYPVLSVFNGYTPPQLRGSGTTEDPYLISDALELGAMACCSSDASYRLAASIDLSGIHWGTPVVPWFGGSFDGNGHVIKNLHIHGARYLGLFGQLGSTASVSNLGLEAVEVSGTRIVGSLVGENNGSITTSHSSGSVSSGGGPYESVGGLVGSNGGSIASSYSSGLVRGGGGPYGSVGGLAGSNGGSIATSCSVCAVSGNSSVGGLVGENSGSITMSHSSRSAGGTESVGGLVGHNSGTVAQCQSAAEVNGGSDIGGLVGYNVGRVIQSYSRGAVTGDHYVGGLMGENNLGEVVQCYATGATRSSGSSAGGLAVVSYHCPVTNCFWDMQTSCQATSAGGTGKTTVEMQTASTFLDAGWDFVGETVNGTDDIWWILEGKDYPRLWWELDEVEEDGNN